MNTSPKSRKDISTSQNDILTTPQTQCDSQCILESDSTLSLSAMNVQIDPKSDFGKDLEGTDFPEIQPFTLEPAEVSMLDVESFKAHNTKAISMADTTNDE